MIKPLERIFVKRLKDVSTAALKRAGHWDKVRRECARLKVSKSIIIYHMFVSAQVPSCNVCSKPVEFLRLKSGGYRKFCGDICRKSPEGQAIRMAGLRKTLKKRHGVTNPSHMKSYLSKRRATWIRKYGVDHPNKSRKVQAQRRENCIRLYGFDHPSKSAAVTEKRRATCMKRYGVDSVLKYPSVIEAIPPYVHEAIWRGERVSVFDGKEE